MTKILALPGLELRDAILSGAASLAEMEAASLDPKAVWEIKADREATHFKGSLKASTGTDKPRTRRYVYSDERVDRHGDVILAKGWDVDEFAKVRGPILWGHNHGAPPIGLSSRPKRAEIDGVKSLIGDVTFAEAEVNPDADLIFRLVEAGFLKTGSVGFRPRDAKYGDEISDKERERYGLSKYGMLYTAQELLEFSIVSVPANPGAREIEKGLKMLVETGAAKGTDIDRLVKTYPLTAKQAEERVKESVRGFLLLSPEVTKAVAELAEEAQVDDEPEVEEPAGETEQPAEIPADLEERIAELEDGDHDAEAVRALVRDALEAGRNEARGEIVLAGEVGVTSALAKLTESLAPLVDACTLNTESAVETAKATRQLADAAYNLLERSGASSGERGARGADPNDDGEGKKGGSGEETNELDADALEALATAAKALAKQKGAPE